MTQEMLLQSFMQGFLHDLFVEKWHRFGRYHWFIYSVLVDGTEYFMLIIFALYLKYWLCSAFLLRFYAISALCLGWCGSALNDVRAIWLCYNNLRSASEGTFSEDAPTVGVDGTRTRVSVGGESNVNPVEKIAQFADYSASVLKSSSQVLKSSSQRQMDVFWDVLEWIRHHTIHIKWLGGITFSIACFRVLCATAENLVGFEILDESGSARIRFLRSLSLLPVSNAKCSLPQGECLKEQTQNHEWHGPNGLARCA